MVHCINVHQFHTFSGARRTDIPMSWLSPTPVVITMDQCCGARSRPLVSPVPCDRQTTLAPILALVCAETLLVLERCRKQQQVAHALIRRWMARQISSLRGSGMRLRQILEGVGEQCRRHPVLYQ